MPPLMQLPRYELQNTQLDTEPVTNALMQNRAYGLQQERVGMDRERLDMQKAESAEQANLRKVQRWGSVARVIDEMTDSPQKQAMAQRVWSSNPELSAHLDRSGIDRNHPGVWKFLMAEAGKYDPLGEKLKLAELAKTQAQTGLATAQIGNLNSTEDIKEFEYAKRGGFQGGLDDWLRVKKAQGLGKTPIFGTGPDGGVAVFQLGDGSLQPAQIPKGYAVDPRNPLKIDTGTGTMVLGNDGRTIANVPKDIAGKEAQEEIGKAQGKSVADLPRVEDNAARALQTIEQIRSHPGRPWATGALGVVPGVPGTAQRGFINLVEQAKGQTFLEAFNSLRGGGQITEAEGAKATQALARLDRAQNQQDFDAALKDLSDVIKIGAARARVQAGKGVLSGGSGAPAAVAPGAYRWTPDGGLQPSGGR